MRNRLLILAVALLTSGSLYAASFLSGSGAPSGGTGSNGDLYHRTDIPSIYGPKSGGVWPSTFSYIVGKGCTTGYHIDKDCDGYGVGPSTWTAGGNMTLDPNPLFGRDADDNDVTVSSAAGIIAKWGSINTWLTHVGYPTNRVVYVDPVNGNDSNSGTFASPYHDYDAFNAVWHADGAGGTVIYRGSTGALINGIGICGYGGPCYNPTAWLSPTNPVVLLTYPGEESIINGTQCMSENDNIGNNISENVIWDGWTCVANTYGVGNGYGADHTVNTSIVNSEFTGWDISWETGSGSIHPVIDNDIFHDQVEHAIYPTSAGLYTTSRYDCANALANYDYGVNGVNPFTDFVVSNSLFYNGGSGGFEPIHLNAVICGATITGNIIWNSGGTGLGLQTGVQNALVANNVIYSNQSAAMTLSVYGCDNNADPAGCTVLQLANQCLNSNYGLGTHYFPDEINNIKIINNTFWTGHLGPPGGGNCVPGSTCPAPSYGIDVIAYDCGIPDARTLKNLTVQNNVIVTDNDCGPGKNELFFTQRSYPDTDKIKNNLFYSMASGHSQCGVMSIDQSAVTSFSTGTYSFTQLQSYNTTQNSGNMFNDPMFVDVSTNYYLTPQSFNFHPQSGSPAISSGVYLGAPTYDVAGLLRPNPPSVGAYEFVASTVTVGKAKNITYLSGNGQATSTNTEVTVPFYAVVTDSNSLNVQGTTTAWAVTGGGGFLTEVSSVSDVNGRVSALLTTGGSLGVNTVTVSSAGLTGSPVTFTASAATYGPPLTVTGVSGDGSEGMVGILISTPMIAVIADSNTIPVQGATVTWTITSGAGSLSSVTSVSDANGLVKASLTPSVTGQILVTVSSNTFANSPILFVSSADPGSFPGTTGDPLASKYAPAIDTNPNDYLTSFGTITVTDGLYKVFQSSVAPGTNRWITLYAFPNETQSFQVHVSPSVNVSSLSVTISSFTSAWTGAAISTTTGDITAYREWYMNITTPTALSTASYSGGFRGWVPDAIIPSSEPYYHQTTNAFPVSVTNGNTQSAWFDVHVPTYTASGYYVGQVTVSSGSTVILSLPITLEVGDGWVMPSTTTLKMVGSAFSYNGFCNVAYGGTGSCGGYQGAGGSADYANTLQFIDGANQMLDNRWTIDGVSNIYPGSGSFSLYVSSIGPLLNGTTGNQTQTVIPGAALSTIVLNHTGNQTSAVWQNWASSTTNQGWFPRLFNYLQDEPTGGQWATLISSATATHGYSTPIVPNLVTTNISTAITNGATNYIDWMFPIIEDMTPTSGDLRSTYNTWLSTSSFFVPRILGTYNDCESAGTCNNGTVGAANIAPYPNRHIDGNPVSNRAMGTVEYSENVSADLYYDVDYCDVVGCATPSSGGSAINDPWHGQYIFGGNGDGTLMLPSTTTIVTTSNNIPIWVPTIRLKENRDGMQDYEYYNYLNGKGKGSIVTTQIGTWYTNPSSYSNSAATVQAMHQSLFTTIHQITWPPSHLTQSLTGKIKKTGKITSQ